MADNPSGKVELDPLAKADEIVKSVIDSCKVEVSVFDHAIFDPATGKTRSPHWPALRNKIVLAQPWCSICRGTLNLTVHHIRPFHLYPALELDESNLVVLCEGQSNEFSMMNCHFNFGHFGDWKDYNFSVVNDAAYLREMLDRRQRQTPSINRLLLPQWPK